MFFEDVIEIDNRKNLVIIYPTGVVYKYQYIISENNMKCVKKLSTEEIKPKTFKNN
ncbi:hypothetical protein MUSASHINO07_15440 [Gemella sp. Musashino-2025]